jgi:hypothetical protein
MRVKVVVIRDGSTVFNVVGGGPGEPWADLIATACADLDCDEEREFVGNVLSIHRLWVDVPDGVDFGPEDAVRAYEEATR